MTNRDEVFATLKKAVNESKSLHLLMTTRNNGEEYFIFNMPEIKPECISINEKEGIFKVNEICTLNFELDDDLIPYKINIPNPDCFGIYNTLSGIEYCFSLKKY